MPWKIARDDEIMMFHYTYNVLIAATHGLIPNRLLSILFQQIQTGEVTGMDNHRDHNHTKLILTSTIDCLLLIPKCMD
jgi:hypothetical protein